MTKREARRQTEQENTLLNLGFTREEAEQLRRISLTLHRWYEHECNGTIQREGEDSDGRPFWYSTDGDKIGPAPDREQGAIKRLKAIIGQRNGRPAIMSGRLNAAPSGPVSYYLQTDPRGAVLYIIRPGDVPAGADVASYYSRGVCVY